MARRSRDTLKLKFSQGAMPSSEAFSDLIESALNIVDQQFDKTAQDGLKVGQFSQGRLLSFYHDIDVKSPVWAVRMEQPGDDLMFGTPEFPSALTLRDRNGNATDAALQLEPSTDDDRAKQGLFELDIKGMVVADGRQGRAGMRVPADGEWQFITPVLHGVQAFEVMAGAGKTGSGKYAILHAFAMKAFNGKDDITYHQAYCGSRCSQLELRWKAESSRLQDGYRLQIRCGCPYDSKDDHVGATSAATMICYQLTQLWFDSGMKQCQVRDREGAA
jgi:hypothetical protein